VAGRCGPRILPVLAWTPTVHGFLPSAFIANECAGSVYFSDGKEWFIGSFREYPSLVFLLSRYSLQSVVFPELNSDLCWTWSSLSTLYAVFHAPPLPSGFTLDVATQCPTSRSGNFPVSTNFAFFTALSSPFCLPPPSSLPFDRLNATVNGERFTGLGR